MKKKSTSLYLIILPIVVLLYFSNNIYGHFRFKYICQRDSGLRVYQKLERDKGWLVDTKEMAQAVAPLKGIGFARYFSRSGVAFDVHYIGGWQGDNSSFDIKPADLNKKVFYALAIAIYTYPDEIRLSRSGYEIRDIQSLETTEFDPIEQERLLVGLYHVSYSLFDKNRTILAAPSGTRCGVSMIETLDNSIAVFGKN
jgi:hypothetical protein